MSENREYYTLLIEWAYDDSEQGAFGWGGWASSPEEAEDMARREMYAESEERTEDDPEEGIETDGMVIDMFVGGQTTAAPQVADIIDELLSGGHVEGVTLEKLELAMELLRPGYKEEMGRSADQSPSLGGM